MEYCPHLTRLNQTLKPCMSVQARCEVCDPNHYATTIDY